MTHPDHDQDHAILVARNADYIAADQGSDVALYDKFLAPDFTATLPDLVFRNRAEFLDLISQPRPFTALTVTRMEVRFLTDDVALIHGRVSYSSVADGRRREALYTDTYQKRDGVWWCVAGEVVAEGQ